MPRLTICTVPRPTSAASNSHANPPRPASTAGKQDGDASAAQVSVQIKPEPEDVKGKEGAFPGSLPLLSSASRDERPDRPPVRTRGRRGSEEGALVSARTDRNREGSGTTR